MFRSGPVRVRVLIFPVRVFPSGPGFNFSGPVRSGPGFKNNPVRVVVCGPGLTFSRSGPGFTFKNLFGIFQEHVPFVNCVFGWN